MQYYNHNSHSSDRQRLKKDVLVEYIVKSYMIYKARTKCYVDHETVASRVGKQEVLTYYNLLCNNTIECSLQQHSFYVMQMISFTSLKYNHM